MLVPSLLAISMIAADSNDWAVLSRELKTGDRIDVVQTSMATARGTFQIVSPDGIVIHEDAGDRTIAKDAVVRISVRDRSHRVLNGVLLGAVGGVAGAGIMRFGISCAETNDGCRNVKLATFGGAAAGAVIGAMLPAGSKVVYRVAKLPNKP
jgi:hypothetical protein